jgi:hypothetical protein
MQGHLEALAGRTQEDSQRAAQQVSQAKLAAAELEEQLAAARAGVGCQAQAAACRAACRLPHGAACVAGRAACCRCVGAGLVQHGISLARHQLLMCALRCRPRGPPQKAQLLAQLRAAQEEGEELRSKVEAVREYARGSAGELGGAQATIARLTSELELLRVGGGRGAGAGAGAGARLGARRTWQLGQLTRPAPPGS